MKYFFNKFEFADTESKSHYDIDLEPLGFFFTLYINAKGDEALILLGLYPSTSSVCLPEIC